MATLMIDDVDEALLEDLGRLAERNSIAIEQQARQLLRRALPLRDRAELVARLEAIAALTPKDVVQTDSVELLREDRSR